MGRMEIAVPLSISKSWSTVHGTWKQGCRRRRLLRCSARLPRQTSNAPEVELSKINSETEDLRLRLKQVTDERDRLESVFTHIKKANSQRENECKQLRSSITEDRQHVRLLQSQLQTCKAEVTSMAARAQLDSDAVVLRNSIS